MQDTVYTQDEKDTAWIESLNKRVSESQSHWNSKYKLDQATKKNEKLYLNESTDDFDDDERRADNRIFSSIRTIVPYVTTRITEPEVLPSSNAQEAKKFAEDFEKAIYAKAGMEKVRQKMKYALEDGIIRRRGYLKLRYDAQTGNFCKVEYVPAECIIIDHKSRPYEEPRYFRHVLDNVSVKDMLTMFPDAKNKIYQEFGLNDNSPAEEFNKCYTINEDWSFESTDKGLDLFVTWHYNKCLFEKIKDPNWRYGKTNFLEQHMMPLVFVNVLNDGRGHIDRTTFVEQAEGLQENVYERGNQISKNAGLGNTGMPVVNSGVLADDQSQYLEFEEDTVLELEIPEGSRIQDHFDVWKAGAMPAFVFDDKIDSRNAIDNAFGTPNVFRGEQSQNNTLGQDVLVRDQAFGRQQEMVDAIDAAAERLYILMAQFLLVYGNEQELFKFVGDNAQFDYVLLNTDNLDTNVLIRVKSGTSMPIDRAQRRATADKAASMRMIDPLTYWEIMDEGNAEKYAKRLVDFTNDPASFLKDVNEDVFDRNAFVDIELLKQGATPPFRKDLLKEYFDYLNKWILNGNLNDPEIDQAAKIAIQQFIDTQLARGQQMLGMAETQLPTPEEVNAANEQTDQQNQQAQTAAEQDMKMQQANAKLQATKQPVAKK